MRRDAALYVRQPSCHTSTLVRVAVSFGATSFGRLILTTALFGAIGSFHGHDAIVTSARDVHSPRIAADLAVLYKRSSKIRLYVDLDLFAAVRTGDQYLISHCWRILVQRTDRPLACHCGHLV